MSEEQNQQQQPSTENTENQEFDIQHDDEFEDFKVNMPKTSESNQQGEWLDDWDDDIVENFTAMLAEQRKLIQ